MIARTGLNMLLNWVTGPTIKHVLGFEAVPYAVRATTFSMLYSKIKELKRCKTTHRYAKVIQSIGTNPAIMAVNTTHTSRPYRRCFQVNENTLSYCKV